MKEIVSALLSKIGWHINRSQQVHIEAVREDLCSHHLLPDLELKYIPWTEASLRPAAVRALLNETVIHDRRRILEFGTGLSTLFLADYFKSQEPSGRVVSVEEDDKWRDIVKEYLHDLGVTTRHCQIIEAPLRPYEESGSAAHWYDTSVLREKLSGEEFDMVFVDGPVAWKEGREGIRYPALPFASRFISDDPVVFLDDAAREEESRISQLWADEYDLEYDHVAGMAVFRLPDSNATRDIL